MNNLECSAPSLPIGVGEAFWHTSADLMMICDSSKLKTKRKSNMSNKKETDPATAQQSVDTAER
jgi:hypothetical protein